MISRPYRRRCHDADAAPNSKTPANLFAACSAGGYRRTLASFFIYQFLLQPP
jgi:hypothetical protein